MPTAYKVLGQNSPAANTDTTLYTVPSSTSTIVSTISVCNTSLTLGDFIYISVRPAGESLASKHYMFFNEPIAPSSNLSITIGLTLATTDVITIKSLNGISSFNAYGSEIS